MTFPNLNAALAWRTAIKKFDETRTIPETDLQYILEAGNLMPTAYGLQPFRIISVVDQDTKDKLIAASYNQEHVAKNSALIVLAIRTDIDSTMIAEYTNRLEKIRDLAAGSADGFKDAMIGDLLSRSEDARNIWSAKQAYIALGGMIAAASERGIDNHGLEGFSPEQYNDILGLAEHNLHATVILALGYRIDETEAAQLKKVRVALPDMVIKR